MEFLGESPKEEYMRGRAAVRRYISAKTTALRTEVIATMGSVKKRRGGLMRDIVMKWRRDGVALEGGVGSEISGWALRRAETRLVREWEGRDSRMRRRARVVTRRAMAEI
jgi:hypothetical protein